MAVQTQYRRKGIASALLRAAEIQVIFPSIDIVCKLASLFIIKVNALSSQDGNLKHLFHSGREMEAKLGASACVS